MLMAYEDAFLEAIIRDPDDDGLRLIYADWLDEHDDPRGEFIRVQCALARLPDDDPRRHELAVRERELLAAHRETWLRPFSELHEDYSCFWQFHHGLLEQIALPARCFLEHADALFRLGPIRHARLVEADPVLP